MVALVQASVALPVMLLSLVAGALADNRDRRAVMLGTQFFMLTVSIALAGLCLGRADHSVVAAGVHFSDRLWLRVQCPSVAGLGRRHGAARGIAGRGRAQ